MTLLISADELYQLQEENTPLVIVDCRYDLNNFRAGYLAYLEGHIPDAWYVHLLDDLTDSSQKEQNPYALPQPEQFRDLLQRLALTPNCKLVIYDGGSQLAAARLWWLAIAYGHRDAAILDGGIEAYRQKYPLSRGIIPNRRSSYGLRAFTHLPHLNSEELIQELKEPSMTLIDCRDPINHRVELKLYPPLKGAYSLPYTRHLNEEGLFLPKRELLKNFRELIALDRPLLFYSQGGLASQLSYFALSLVQLEGNAAIYTGNILQYYRNESASQ